MRALDPAHRDARRPCATIRCRGPTRSRMRAKHGVAVSATPRAAVLGRRQPVGPLDRSGRPRGPVGRAARGRVRVDRGAASPAGDARRRVDRFEDGVPTAEGSQARDLVAHLNARAGAHGVGRIDLIEDRVVGVKSREVYECPGSVTLIAAHRALERLVLTRDELRMKAALDQKYGELIYDGLWALAAARRDRRVQRGARRAHDRPRAACGCIAGAATVTGTSSPFALYDERLATYGRDDRFRHDAGRRLHRTVGTPDRVGCTRRPRRARERRLNGAGAAVGRRASQRRPTRAARVRHPRSKTISCSRRSTSRARARTSRHCAGAASSTPRRGRALEDALDAVAAEIDAGTFATPRAQAAREDVHGAIDERVRALSPAAGACAPRRTQPQRSGRDDAPALRARSRAAGRGRLRADRARRAGARRGGARRRNGDAGRDDALAARAADALGVLATVPCAENFARAARALRRGVATDARDACPLGSARLHRLARCRSTRGAAAARARLCRALAQRARRCRRPRRRARPAARRHARAARGLARLRGTGRLLHAGVRLRAAGRRGRDRFEPDAAEAQPGSVRTRARRRVVGGRHRWPARRRRSPASRLRIIATCRRPKRSSSAKRNARWPHSTRSSGRSGTVRWNRAALERQPRGRSRSRPTSPTRSSRAAFPRGARTDWSAPPSPRPSARAATRRRSTRAPGRGGGA